jgi:hypothetical protein
VKKMNTPRELYLQCLDGDFWKTPIPRICYKISMDSSKKAAQATIDNYAKSNVKLLLKKSHGPYSDSDTSSFEEQVVSNSNLPSLTSLKDFINGLPHFEPLHFGFYLNDDKNPSCLCPCVKGVTRWRESLGIDWENEELCGFCLLSSKGLLQHCSDKGGSYHKCTLYYLEKLDIKPGKTWCVESTLEKNRKGDDVTGSVDKKKHLWF